MFVYVYVCTLNNKPINLRRDLHRVLKGHAAMYSTGMERFASLYIAIFNVQRFPVKRAHLKRKQTKQRWLNSGLQMA